MKTWLRSFSFLMFAPIFLQVPECGPVEVTQQDAGPDQTVTTAGYIYRKSKSEKSR